MTYYLPNQFQAIAIHTFIVVLWGKLKEQFIVAYVVVALIWIFVILYVSISVGIHTHGSSHYETPTPVSQPIKLSGLPSY
jgi:hypothetical protein